jgi:hypothetical protein
MHIELDHGCGRTHHGYQSLAECTFPDAAYVTGDGPYALVARCDMLSVALYETEAEVRRRRKRLETTGCGRACEHRHEVVLLGASSRELLDLP